MFQPAIPDFIGSLLNPSAYPHPVDHVDLIQTHISYVLLAGDHVYKIKKPVSFGFVDFSSLAKRRFACGQEVALNRELCANTYLGVSTITESDEGVRVDGSGPVVEYAVHMRRLSAERMMDRLIDMPRFVPFKNRRMQLAILVADRLADFHRAAPTSRHIAEEGDKAIRRFWDENFAEWKPFIGNTISAEQDEQLRAFGQRFLLQHSALMQKRVDELRIRDCHGDLRSDAICFLENGEVCIYDRLEFNRRLRYTDVAGDVGFLAMDLDYRGRPDLADLFVKRYVEVTGDVDMLRVIDFYKCYRACVRGKVESLRSVEPEVPDEQRREAEYAAHQYFTLATRYAAGFRPACLLVTCGLSASGKSSLARKLGEVLDMDVLLSDVIRKQLAGRALEDHQTEGFEEGIYSVEFTRRTYESMFDSAHTILRSGRSVILDASFSNQSFREDAVNLARSADAPFLFIECRASEAVTAERLAHRLREGRDPSDARWDIYLEQRRRFEPITEVPKERHLVVDTDQSLNAEVRAVEARLSSLAMGPADK